MRCHQQYAQKPQVPQGIRAPLQLARHVGCRGSHQGCPVRSAGSAVPALPEVPERSQAPDKPQPAHHLRVERARAWHRGHHGPDRSQRTGPCPANMLPLWPIFCQGGNGAAPNQSCGRFQGSQIGFKGAAAHGERLSAHQHHGRCGRRGDMRCAEERAGDCGRHCGRDGAGQQRLGSARGAGVCGGALAGSAHGGQAHHHQRAVRVR
mmetsp:Transcript_27898/g.71811  ORF Transcript_27898/g.71811 Transcript_27898/m.71811 type:complete len:207 (+) Transcript_27898:151-771(+)